MIVASIVDSDGETGWAVFADLDPTGAVHVCPTLDDHIANDHIASPECLCGPTITHRESLFEDALVYSHHDAAWPGSNEKLN